MTFDRTAKLGQTCCILFGFFALSALTSFALGWPTTATIVLAVAGALALTANFGLMIYAIWED